MSKKAKRPERERVKRRQTKLIIKRKFPFKRLFLEKLLFEAKKRGRKIRASIQAASQFGWPKVEKTRRLTS
mgnify:CR=1 FL=1